jgi:hypothetical protein
VMLKASRRRYTVFTCDECIDRLHAEKGPVWLARRGWNRQGDASPMRRPAPLPLPGDFTEPLAAAISFRCAGMAGRTMWAIGARPCRGTRSSANLAAT